MPPSGKDRDSKEPEVSRPVASRAPQAIGAPPGRAGPHANTGLVIVFMSLAGLSYAVLQSLVAPALNDAKKAGIPVIMVNTQDPGPLRKDYPPAVTGSASSAAQEGGRAPAATSRSAAAAASLPARPAAIAPTVTISGPTRLIRAP